MAVYIVNGNIVSDKRVNDGTVDGSVLNRSLLVVHGT